MFTFTIIIMAEMLHASITHVRKKGSMLIDHHIGMKIFRIWCGQWPSESNLLQCLPISWIAFNRLERQSPIYGTGCRYSKGSMGSREFLPHCVALVLLLCYHPKSCQNINHICQHWIVDAHTLTQWGRDKMATISLATPSNAFSWMETCEFRLKFHLCLFLRVQLTTFQHWLR